MITFKIFQLEVSSSLFRQIFDMVTSKVFSYMMAFVCVNKNSLPHYTTISDLLVFIIFDASIPQTTIFSFVSFHCVSASNKWRHKWNRASFYLAMMRCLWLCYGSDWKFGLAAREGNCFPWMARVKWEKEKEEMWNENGNSKGRVWVGKQDKEPFPPPLPLLLSFVSACPSSFFIPILVLIR